MNGFYRCWWYFRHVPQRQTRCHSLHVRISSLATCSGNLTSNRLRRSHLNISSASRFYSKSLFPFYWISPEWTISSSVFPVILQKRWPSSAFFLMQSLSLKFGLCVGIYQRIATAYGFYRLSTWPNDHPKCKRHWSARDSILVDWLHSKIPTSLICIATWYPICSEGTVGEIDAAFSCVSGKWPKVISHACNKKNKMHVL